MTDKAQKPIEELDDDAFFDEIAPIRERIAALRKQIDAECEAITKVALRHPTSRSATLWRVAESIRDPRMSR